MDGGWVGIRGPRFLQGVDVPGPRSLQGTPPEGIVPGRYTPRKVHTQEGTPPG